MGPGRRASTAWILLFALALSVHAHAAQNAPWTTFARPGRFITCLHATDGALWIGTEDHGLWRLDLLANPAGAGAWTQFTGDDGPHTKHVYGLAEDTAGRLWVGTVNAGVSVYSGEAWRNYGVLDGCLGERVFAIAADADPQRGHVWIGTDQGLTCWTPAPKATADAAPGQASLAPGTWRTVTRTDGLPSDQVTAVAVGPGGQVWLGTECDGLAWARPPYRQWHTIRAQAERSGDEGEAPGIRKGTAPGLPSNLINDLVVTDDGTIVAATDYGLGIGRPGGRAWVGWQGLATEPFRNTVRGLAVDAAGDLWLATRHKGLARLSMPSAKVKTFQKQWPKGKKKRWPPLVNYVFDVAVTRSGEVWAGTYGGGLAVLNAKTRATSTRAFNPVKRGHRKAEAPPLPAPAPTPGLEELGALLVSLARVPYVAPERQPLAVRLDDDWLTKGDCLGRYGRYYGCWCAICSPRNYIWGAGPEKVEYHSRTGENRRRGDTLRYWVHWLYTTNPNTLEMPPTYLHSRVVKGFTTWDKFRRQAEWDDHGEAYPRSHDGPHLYYTLRVPAGLFTLSLYNFNKDGHTRNNRFRDYWFSIRPHPAGTPLHDIQGFDRWPKAARGRMQDFWNGVYKRFLVRGPCEITVHQNRNHSHNTIMAGVFLDLVDEYPVPYFKTVQAHEAEEAKREEKRTAMLREVRTPGGRARRFAPAKTEAEAARRLFAELEAMHLWNPVWQMTDGRGAYARLLKWLLSEIERTEAGPARRPLYRMATTCYYHLGRYEKWEAGQTLLGLTTARQVEKALRWDQKTYSYQGKGFHIVAQYLEKSGLRPGSGQTAGAAAAELSAQAERAESRASGP